MPRGERNGQSSGAMEEVSRKVHNASTYSNLPTECTNSHVARDEHKGQSNGAMEEMSRKVQEVRTYSRLPSKCSR